jgi:hypothetical protein
MTTKPQSKPADATQIESALAALAEREAELAKREAALAEREKSLPPARFTIRGLHRAVIANPAITEAELTEMATKAGAEFKPVTVRTQMALTKSFVKMLTEAGYTKQEKAA